MNKINEQLSAFSILSIKAYKFRTPKLSARLYMIKNKQKMTKIPIFLESHFYLINVFWEEGTKILDF